MRSRNHPDTTRYNYVLAAAQLARYLKEHSPDVDSHAFAGLPARMMPLDELRKILLAGHR